MSLTFPLQMPSKPGIKNIVWTASGKTAFTESEFTRQRQYFAFNGDLLAAEIELPRMPRDVAAQWIAWGAAMRGRKGSFQLAPLTPERIPLGLATGSPQISGAGQTGSTINTKGWTNSKTPIIKAGSWISFGVGIERLYMVLADANSDGSGNATLELFPSVREATTDSDDIATDTCSGLFRLDSDSFQWDIQLYLNYGVKFKAIEAI